MEINGVIDTGQAADVFIISNEKVLKAFKRQRHRPAIDYSLEDYDGYISAQFRAEKWGYEQVQQFERLRKHTPKYYGSVNPLDFLPRTQLKNTEYVKDCGIILERVRGAEYKIRDLSGSLFDAVVNVLDEISDVIGVLDVTDASCIINKELNEFKIIDFCTWSSEDYGSQLYSKGYLDVLTRAKLESEFCT